jgi:hypothetical protein
MVARSRLDIQNPRDFYVVDKLQNDMKMNSKYFITHILNPIEEVIFLRGRNRHYEWLIVHVDNCAMKERVSRKGTSIIVECSEKMKF